ncbi:MAG: VCBS repeat-containing protein [Thermoanaerobaculia bacterium]|nr:VCBS repeat-containing protein [Thermoanaerobaculia bacterium]
MKRLALVLPFALLAWTGCSSTPRSDAPAPAPEASADAAKEAAAREAIAERERKTVEAARMLAGLPPVPEEDTSERQEWIIFTDPTTGKKLQRIPKNPSLRVVDGKLRHTQLNPRMFTLDLVREDEGFYYVAAPEDVPEKPPVDEEAIAEGLRRIVEVDPLEYEVVTPSLSKVQLRLEEKSDGLPTSGFWRSNMAVADLDGDGRPEIVTTPPRLGMGTIEIFRYDGARWASIEPVIEGDETLRYAYGGVAVADMDGDGRPDVVSIGHGAGPFVSYNLGGFRFRREERGLPRQMSGRAVSAGDLDGDGRIDLVAISDESEGSNLRRLQAKAEAEGRPVPGGSEDGYKLGIDTRAFFGGADGKFVERSAGLEVSCFGYTLELNAAPRDAGAPFFASGCRYQGGRAILFEYDRQAGAFFNRGRGLAEDYAFHSGTALGTYQGKPAAFVTYVKGNARGATKGPIRGHGLSVYYREGQEWKRKRLLKVLANVGTESQGIGVGDLNGDGLDDVALADDAVGRVRVFFQTQQGEFEELDPALQPKHVNRSMSVKITDVDGDGKNDVVLMYEYRTAAKTRAGGIRFFRNAG